MARLAERRERERLTLATAAPLGTLWCSVAPGVVKEPIATGMRSFWLPLHLFL